MIHPAPVATFTIRPIQASDQEALVRFYAGLSPDSREARFHGAVRGISPGTASSFCHPDHEHREGVVAEAIDGRGRRVVIGHVCVEPVSDGVLEVAVAVADDWRRQGVARAMLLDAVAWARRRGATSLVAMVRCGNGAMIGLARSLGLPVTASPSPASDAIELRLDLHETVRPAA